MNAAKSKFHADFSLPRMVWCPQDSTQGQQSEHQLSSYGEEVERMKELEIEVTVSLCVRALLDDQRL